MQPAVRRLLLHRLVKRIDVRREKVEITVRPGAIAGGVNPALSANDLRLEASDEDDGVVAVLTIPTRLRRTGEENRLLMEAASSEATAWPDRGLLRVLAQVHLFQEMVKKGDGATLPGSLASAHPTSPGSSGSASLHLSDQNDPRGPPAEATTGQALTVGSFQIATSWKKQAIELGLASA